MGSYIIKIISISLLNLFAQNNILAQRNTEQGFLTASETFNRGRFNLVIISETGIAAFATIGLQYLWYKKFPKSRFHFFNDNDEWLNMDKVGHATSAYNISALQYNLMRWSGEKKSASLLIACATALAYMSMIEISDGFSAEWGFSKGDMLANITGTAFFGIQQSIWQQQKIQLRFSYHNSIYAKYNPGELGKTLPEKLFKDYNGQTYWASINLSSFLGTKSNFPQWINADVGYGAEGMTGAVINPTLINGERIPSFTRQRKLYLGIGGAFPANGNISYPSWINLVRLPSPVLEWKLYSDKIIFKPIMF